MVNARANVGAPSKSPLTYGLFSVAEMRRSTDPHWKNGVTWRNVCPDAGSTYDECISPLSLGVTGLSEVPAKAATAEISIWGATPFTVVVEIDCAPVGDYWNTAQELVNTTFTQAEQQEVEGIFWSGVVADTAGIAYPHLASATTLSETEPGGATLQLTTASLAPSGGGSLDVVEALGKLEQAMSACIKGKGVVHIRCELLPHLKANHLLEEENGVFYTPGGHKLAVSAGYLGSAPDGSVQVGVSWMYGTGPVFLYTSNGRFIGERKESMDLDVNTLKRIYERTYVAGFDCCLFAVPVSTGGVTTGAIDSAT